MKRPLFAAALAGLLACGGSSNSNKMVGPCTAPVNGCTSFTDLTAVTATISFGGGLGLAYSPRCARVKVGQPITFNGDFGAHPLSETCGPIDAIPSKPSGTTLTFSLGTAGTYGYQCDVHHAAGMTGAIDVVP